MVERHHSAGMLGDVDVLLGIATHARDELADAALPAYCRPGVHTLRGLSSQGGRPPPLRQRHLLRSSAWLRPVEPSYVLDAVDAIHQWERCPGRDHEVGLEYRRQQLSARRLPGFMHASVFSGDPILRNP